MNTEFEFTIENVERLQAGPYLDALLGERLFGLKVSWGQRKFLSMWESLQCKTNQGECKKVPRFSTAHKLIPFIERAYKEMYGSEMQVIPYGLEDAFIALNWQEEELTTPAYAKTQALAICRCVLRTVVRRLSQKRERTNGVVEEGEMTDAPEVIKT